jgi:hypothetical protein
MTIHIESILESKKKYELAITSLLRDFQKETGVVAESIEINEPHYFHGAAIKRDFDINIKIKNPFNDI